MSKCSICANHLKDWKCYLLIAAILALCYVCNDYRDENRQLIDAHHDYVRRTELKQATIESRLALMDGVTMPMPEMSVEHGELLYRGQKWDCMSDSERIIVSISLARAINPECGFTTANRFEQLDIDTQNEVREWCKREGFQVIAARVSTNPEECTLIIEDGRIKD